MGTRHLQFFCFYSLFFAIFFFTPPLVAMNDQYSEKDIIARVNDSVITHQDFTRALNNTLEQFTDAGEQLDESKLSDIKSQVLDSLIDRELLYQEGTKAGITIDETAVDRQLQSFKKGFLNDAQFEAALASHGLSEAILRNEASRALTVKQLIEKKILTNISVSEKEIKDHYLENRQLYQEPEKVRASHILIRIDPAANESEKAQAREKLEIVKNKLREGQSFESLVRSFSQCPTRMRDGDLGFFQRGQMEKAFEDVAFSLKPGKISDIVETSFGYHLIKVTGKLPAISYTFEEARARVKDTLKNDKMQSELDLYVKNLRDKAQIKTYLHESP